MLWEVGGAKTASLFKKFMSNLENEIVTSDNGRKACSSLQLSPTMLQKKKKEGLDHLGLKEKVLEF